MFEEENYNALLAWISVVESTEIQGFKDMWRGDTIHSIMKKIGHFTISEYKQPEDDAWMDVFQNIRALYKDLEDFYRLKLHKSSFDNNFCNITLFAKNKDPEQISNFCLQLFGAAVQASNKETFISAILGLSSDNQTSLMNLIQTFRFYDSGESVLKVEDHTQNERRVLLAKVESLQAENQKLQKQVEAILQNRQQQQQRCRHLQQQYKKLRDQFEQRMEEIENQPRDLKGQSEVDNVQNSLVEQLKQKLLQVTVTNNSEKQELRDTIDFLKEKLQHMEHQLKSGDRNSNNASVNLMTMPDHPPCISLNKHQELILAQSIKIKEITRKELDLSIQNINLKKEVEQSQREVDRMKTDFIKKSEAINKDDYEAVKINVLSLLRDRFRDEVAKLESK